MANSSDSPTTEKGSDPGGSRAGPKRRRWAKKLLLMFGGLVCGFIVAEIALRVVGVTYPLPFCPDEHCGSRLLPGFRGRWMKEGRAEFSVNSAGFRDREHQKSKPADTLRIAILGDSFVEALQVPFDETFGAVLEKELQSCGALDSRRVEVLNFGVSGHGTAQQLLVLRNYVWDYQPDIILLAFFAGNDVQNNSRELEPYQTRPFFDLMEGRLVLDNSFRQHTDFRNATSAWGRFKVGLINHCRVLQFLNEMRNRSRRSPEPDTRENRQPGIEELGFAEPRTEAWRNAWKITDALITEMNREAGNHKAKLFVVTLSDGVQVHPDPEIRLKCQRRLATNDLLYPSRRLESLADKNDFTVIELIEPMRRYAEKNRVYLHGFEGATLGRGHWNRKGHRLAAELTAGELCRLWKQGKRSE